MADILKEVSTITSKGQTTIPKSVRQALGVGYGDEIAFYVDGESRVSVRREMRDDSDPVIGSFLAFIAAEMERRPEDIAFFPQDLVDRARELTRELTQGMVVDLDKEIEGEVDL